MGFVMRVGTCTGGRSVVVLLRRSAPTKLRVGQTEFPDRDAGLRADVEWSLGIDSVHPEKQLGMLVVPAGFRAGASVR